MSDTVEAYPINPVCPKCDGDMINIECYEDRRTHTSVWSCYCIDCTYIDKQSYHSPYNAIKAWTKEPSK